jgi:hypothetical protein
MPSSRPNAGPSPSGSRPRRALFEGRLPRESVDCDEDGKALCFSSSVTMEMGERTGATAPALIGIDCSKDFMAPPSGRIPHGEIFPLICPSAAVHKESCQIEPACASRRSRSRTESGIRQNSGSSAISAFVARLARVKHGAMRYFWVGKPPAPRIIRRPRPGLFLRPAKASHNKYYV